MVASPSPAPVLAPALAPALAQLRSEPSRTWSIVITLYGDAVLPRGGSLWLGSLLAIFAPLDIGEGVLRTAMSRLAADGWLERLRIGRNSFYRLAERGRSVFAAADARIYGPPPAGDAALRLALATGAAERAALEAAGWGLAAPGLFVAPAAAALPAAAATAIALRTEPDPAAARRLVAQAWPLARSEAAFARFLEAFAPLHEAVAAGRKLAPLDALVARTLLVHQYRRIVLRVPALPAPLLPADWIGHRARALCAATYPALLGPSERWLDVNAVNEDGALPPPPAALRSRFRSPSAAPQHITK